MSARVALIVPTFFGYENRIEAAIKRLGHETIRFDERIGNSFIVKVLTRLRILQKISPIMKRHMVRICSDMEEFEPDKILLINPETIGIDQVSFMRKKFPNAKIILYMWDSSTNKPVTQELAECVDSACSFDVIDCENISGWKHVPLFHSHSSFKTQGKTNKEYDYIFIGSVKLRRIVVLSEIARFLELRKRSYYFYLYAPSSVHYWLFKTVALLLRYPGHLSRNKFDYETYTSMLNSSRAAVDIEAKNQTGLTIRTLEAVFSGIPILTTNQYIFQYDFSKFAPVFVWRGLTHSEIPISTDIKYRDIDTVFFDKYSIDNWVNTLLNGDIPSYTITDPEKSQEQ